MTTTHLVTARSPSLVLPSGFLFTRSGLLLGLLTTLAGTLACQETTEPATVDPAPMPEWGVEAIAQVGAPGDSGEPLTWVGQALLRPDGTIVVSQPTVLSVRLYDSRGENPRVLGGRGEGPGEFSGMERIGRHGDSLFASDWQARRVSFFSPEGEFLSSRGWSLRADPGDEVAGVPVVTGVPSLLLNDGTALVRAISLVPFVPPDQEERSVRRIPILRVDAEGTVKNVVAYEERDRIQVPIMDGGRPYPVTPPFPEEPLIAFDPFGEGVVIAKRRIGKEDESRVFVVLRVNSAGDTVVRRDFPYDAEPIPEEVLSEEVARQRDGLSRRFGAAPDVPNITRAMYSRGLIPEWSVPVTHLAVGADGSIWLRREDTGEDVLIWMVLDQDLRPKGTVRLPRAELVSDALDQVLLTVGEGPWSEPYVTSYRIRR